MAPVACQIPASARITTPLITTQPTCRPRSAMARRLRLLRHVCELRAVVADVCHLVRNDQMVLRIHRGLHVVTNHARAAPARRHRAAIGIGERDLLVRRGEHPLLVGVQLRHLLIELRKLLLEMRRLGGQRFCWLLQIGGAGLIAGQDFLAIEVAAVCNGFECVCLQRCLRRRSTLPRVKFLSRLFTALNLLPSNLGGRLAECGRRGLAANAGSVVDLLPAVQALLAEFEALQEERAGEIRDDEVGDFINALAERRFSVQREQSSSSDRLCVCLRIDKPAMSRVGSGGLPGLSV